MASDQSSNTDAKQYTKPAAGRTGADVLSGVKIDRYKPVGFQSADSVVAKTDVGEYQGDKPDVGGKE